MYCPKCGAENPEGAELCVSCSWVLSGMPSVGVNVEAKTSGLAIASLVCLILCPFTCFLTALPAIICGIVGLVQIERSRGRLKGRGLAIAGMVTPVILIPVAACMMGIMMPALARTRMIAHRMVCGANLSGLEKAMRIYSNDFGGKYPKPASSWCDLLKEHVELSEKSFICPAVKEGLCNYAMNSRIEELGPNAPPELLTTENHGYEGCNVVFVDGHVGFVTAEDVNDLKWE
ncbi:MAG: DUF4190 domain-containing protein [Planctomycetota bacterium]